MFRNRILAESADFFALIERTNFTTEVVVVREIDKSTIEAAAWKEAVARERVIRELASADSPSRSDILCACREFGPRRTRLYERLKACRERPVAGALLNRTRGTQRGVRGSRKTLKRSSPSVAGVLRDAAEAERQSTANRSASSFACAASRRQAGMRCVRGSM